MLVIELQYKKNLRAFEAVRLENKKTISLLNKEIHPINSFWKYGSEYIAIEDLEIFEAKAKLNNIKIMKVNLVVSK